MIEWTTLYHTNLGTNDISHGGRSTKVKNHHKWVEFSSWSASGEFMNLSAHLENGGRILCWSDNHWGHNNIIQYSNRPFSSKEHMGQVMMDNYHSIVQPSDVVIFGGDVCFGSRDSVSQMLQDMPGYKIHIIGNHDIGKQHQPFEFPVQERHLFVTAEVDGRTVLFTHFPMDTMPDGTVNVHGHTHLFRSGKPWNINMCVEHTNYTPIELRELLTRGY